MKIAKARPPASVGSGEMDGPTLSSQQLSFPADHGFAFGFVPWRKPSRKVFAGPRDLYDE